MLSGQQFLNKNSITLMPHPPYLPYLAQSNNIFPLGWKKILKGKHFADVNDVGGKALKGIKIGKFKNFLSFRKNVSVGGTASTESILKVLKFIHVRINTQYFINKFHFWGSSLVLTPLIMSS